MSDGLFAGLMFWTILGIMLAAALSHADALFECGPLARLFLCAVCGPFIFAIGLVITIFQLLSALDAKLFKR